MQISKPIKKLKSQNFKLLDTFFFKLQPKKKKKRLHLHIKSYAIKDGQIRQHTQSYVQNLALIYV